MEYLQTILVSLFGLIGISALILSAKDNWGDWFK